MDEDELDPKSAVTILSRGIPRLFEVNCPRKKIWKYLEQLQALLFGPSGDPFLTFYGSILTPEDCLTSLLNVSKLRKHLEKNPKDSIYLSSTLLEMEHLSPAACEFLNDILPCAITSSSGEDIQPCLELLWKREDKSSLPISLIECMLYKRHLVEELIMSQYKRVMDGSICDWSQKPLIQWSYWSSESPLVFQSVSAIMNQLLISVRNKVSMLNIIHSFIQAVSKLTPKGKSMKSLYPKELQALVGILLINPLEMKTDPCSEKLVEFLSAQIVSHSENPYIFLMLLSHFPEWQVFLEKSTTLDHSTDNYCTS